MVSVKEVVEVMENKINRNLTADPVTKFMLRLEQKALKEVATKEAFEAILEELTTAFMEEPFKTLNEKSLKGK